MRLEFLGLPVDNLPRQEILAKISGFFNSSEHHFITTPNPEMVVEGERDWFFKEAMRQADLAPPDGAGLVWAGRYLFNQKIARFPGVELMEEICCLAAQENKSVYLLGGGEGVAEKTALGLKKKFRDLKIAGAEKGIEIKIQTAADQCPLEENKKYSYGLIFDKNENKRLVEKINRAGPDVLFAAFGHGKQEKWLAEFLPQLPSVRIAMGVGGAFDYLSGKIRRAPKILRKLGLEWLWRLLRQPWRIKRICRAIAIFAFLIRDYKKQLNLPYRQGVIGFIINKEGKFFLAKRKSSKMDYYFFRLEHWQPPQGGMDKGETQEEAVIREVKEETGLSTKIICACPKTYRYDWSIAFMRKGGHGYHFRGQEKKIFLLRYEGEPQAVKLDQKELEDYQWVSLEEMQKLINPLRLLSLQILMKECPLQEKKYL
ncbi:MAG: WecB/TagA/CpsF family glycosyltransferase [Candidatus Magasanikbacteria bacterium]|nr:WecB/TagA/CpsF family glycosyltransferase [Candidatus Magasanikbacteria bacterium]